MPFFVFRPSDASEAAYNGSNVGDEMNVELAAALMDVPPQRLRITVDCPEDTKQKTRQKVMMIGSTMVCAAAGDVIAGIGWNFKHPPSKWLQTLVALNRSALHSSAKVQHFITGLSADDVQWSAVRGHATCNLLKASHQPCPVITGDPALYTAVLIPGWHALLETSSSVRLPPSASNDFHFGTASDGGSIGVSWPPLCVVPYAQDAWLREKLTSLAPGVASVVEVSMPPHAFALRLASCRLVAASAMHGIIITDSVRTPAVWIDHRKTRTRWPLYHPKDNDFNGTGQREAPKYVFNEHPLKFLDYFSGVHRPVARVTSLAQAINMSHGDRLPAPRFTEAELVSMAWEFVAAFPFDRVCTMKDPRLRLAAPYATGTDVPNTTTNLRSNVRAEHPGAIEAALRQWTASTRHADKHTVAFAHAVPMQRTGGVLLVVPGINDAARVHVVLSNLRVLRASKAFRFCIAFTHRRCGEDQSFDILFDWRCNNVSVAAPGSQVAHTCETVRATNPPHGGYVNHVKRVLPSFVEAARFEAVFLLLDDVMLRPDAFDLEACGGISRTRASSRH